MNSESVTYQLSYHKLEQELEALSYDIHICDEQLEVYSTHIADMILRACMDIEAISKILCNKKNPDRHNYHSKFDHQCLQELNFYKDCTLLIMPTQNVTENKLRIYFPFDKSDNDGSKDVYQWDIAYQNLKHNKTTGLTKYGNIKNLLYALSALFTLNCHLSDRDISSTVFCRLLPPNVSYWKPAMRLTRVSSLSGEEKDFYESRIEELGIAWELRT